ncbi:MAG: DUF819 domain-containing protein [Synergistaceae bacterium]|nr:DUF819 domain-containing protein [Synergistaceae bacterium]
MNTLISSDDTWSLWAVITAWAAVSIWLEQNYKWAAQASGVIISLLGAMLLANLNIIPTDSPVYDTVWSYVVLLAVPIMLFKADIKKIWLESGRTFLAFHISALGTIIGVILGLLIFIKFLPEPHKVAAMITGTYIGGTVNYVAMAAQFNTSQNVINAGIVADNFNMTICFFILLTIPSLKFFKSHYKSLFNFNSKDEELNQDKAAEGEMQVAAYWRRHDISLLDIAKVLAAGLILTALSVKIAEFFNASQALPQFARDILGSKYLIVTTLTVLCVSLFPKFFENAHGSQEIGTLLIYIFFVVIGAPASLKAVLTESPMLFVFCTFTVLINILVSLILGKLFNLNLEEILIACNATTGGPTTAAAMAISKGWHSLVLPAMLVGVWGYAIGSWCAVFLANIILNYL